MNTKNKNNDEGQTVRRSTLIVSVIAALLFGLYMGTLIPSFGSFSTPTASSGGSGGGTDSQMAKLNTEINKALEATKADPKNAKAWVKLGNLYYDAGNATESVKAYTRSLELNPNDANVLTDRGTMYRELGQYELALQSYAKATAANPTHKNSLFNAGIILYYDLGRKAEAIEKWEQLLRMDPNTKAPNGQMLKDMVQELR